ncbi:MAG: NUDIX hydrolase [Candidatus Aenigmatarchaeota archaeon]
MLGKWKTLRSKVVYKKDSLGVNEETVDIPSKGKFFTNYVKLNDIVAVVAKTADNKILIVKQYRNPTRTFTFEIPGGYAEKKENLRRAALRELEEETGFKAKKINKILSFYLHPGKMTTKVHIFFAESLVKTETKFDPSEDIEIYQMSRETILGHIKKENFQCSYSLLGVLYAIQKGLI